MSRRLKYNTFGNKVSDGGLVHEVRHNETLYCDARPLWSPPLHVDNSEPTTCLVCVVLSANGKKS